MLGELLANNSWTDLFDLSGHERSQCKRPIGQPDQPVHLQAQRLQDATHLAVLSLGEHDCDPKVRALWTFLGFVQGRFDRAIVNTFDGDALFQGIEPLLGHPAPGPRAVAAHDACRRHLQRTRKSAIIGQQKETF